MLLVAPAGKDADIDKQLIMYICMKFWHKFENSLDMTLSASDHLSVYQHLSFLGCFQTQGGLSAFGYTIHGPSSVPRIEKSWACPWVTPSVK